MRTDFSAKRRREVSPPLAAFFKLSSSKPSFNETKKRPLSMPSWFNSSLVSLALNPFLRKPSSSNSFEMSLVKPMHDLSLSLERSSASLSAFSFDTRTLFSKRSLSAWKFSAKANFFAKSSLFLRISADDFPYFRCRFFKEKRRSLMASILFSSIAKDSYISLTL